MLSLLAKLSFQLSRISARSCFISITVLKIGTPLFYSSMTLPTKWKCSFTIQNTRLVFVTLMATPWTRKIWRGQTWWMPKPAFCLPTKTPKMLLEWTTRTFWSVWPWRNSFSKVNHSKDRVSQAWVCACSSLSQRASSTTFPQSMWIQIPIRLSSSKKLRWIWCPRVASLRVSSTSFPIW